MSLSSTHPRSSTRYGAMCLYVQEGGSTASPPPSICMDFFPKKAGAGKRFGWLAGCFWLVALACLGRSSNNAPPGLAFSLPGACGWVAVALRALSYSFLSKIAFAMVHMHYSLRCSFLSLWLAKFYYAIAI